MCIPSIAEQDRGNIPPVCLEIVGSARKLAGELGVAVEVVLLGTDIENLAELLFSAGADAVHLGNSPEFEKFQSEIFTESIVSLANRHNPQILLVGSTFMGLELAPLIAAKLGTGLTAHCMDLVLDENGVLEQQIPAYGGLMTIVCPEKRPQITTIARGVFPMPEMAGGRSGRVLPVEPPRGIGLRAQTLEVVHTESPGVPLETAPIVVAGGSGAGSLDGWREIRELAETLNAGLGSTRPAVDEGWTDLETMIGQSGKMVNPEVYIGVGLSGEQQHMVGITGAKIMIAINNDPKAPVFEQVDYGIVEDCRVFIPALVESLKNLDSHAGGVDHVI